MKTIFSVLWIACLVLCTCVNKTDQASNDTDNISDSIQALEATAEAPGSTQTLTLKWKSVSMTEYGMYYEFEDESGTVISASRLGIPDFSDDENDYFTRTPIEGTVFSQFEIKSESKDKWFDVTLKTTQEVNEMADDGSMTDVTTIIAIKSH